MGPYVYMKITTISLTIVIWISVVSLIVYSKKIPNLYKVIGISISAFPMFYTLMLELSRFFI